MNRPAVEDVSSQRLATIPSSARRCVCSGHSVTHLCLLAFSAGVLSPFTTGSRLAQQDGSPVTNGLDWASGNSCCRPCSPSSRGGTPLQNAERRSHVSERHCSQWDYQTVQELEQISASLPVFSTQEANAFFDAAKSARRKEPRIVERRVEGRSRA